MKNQPNMIVVSLCLFLETPLEFKHEMSISTDETIPVEMEQFSLQGRYIILLLYLGHFKKRDIIVLCAHISAPFSWL